jgi:hypothetical protein
MIGRLDLIFNIMLVFLEVESYIAICFFIAQLCVIIRASLFSMGSEFLVILGRILDCC